MFWRRQKPTESKNAPTTDATPRYPPQVHQFHCVEDWLVAWVSYRLQEKKGTFSDYNVNGRKCLGLIGSIGLDSAIAENGTFFVHLGMEDDASWQPATPQERLWLIVCVQRRLYPEFSVLLPLRPITAVDCSECSGSGFIYRNTVVCSSCSALGWLPADET